MKTKQPTQKNAPDREEILSAISDSKYELSHIESQRALLRGLLVPEYTTDLTEDEIELKVKKVRDGLRDFMVSHGKFFQTGHGKMKRLQQYGRQDLFEMGPERTVKENWLYEHGWEDPQDEGEVEDSSDVEVVNGEPQRPIASDDRSSSGEVVEVADPTLRLKAGTDTPESTAAETRSEDSSCVEVASPKKLAPQGERKEPTEGAFEAITNQNRRKRRNSEAGYVDEPAEKRQKSAPALQPSPPQSAGTESSGDVAVTQPPDSMIERHVPDYQSIRDSPASLGDEAKVPPTKQPARSGEIINPGHSDWVQQQMHALQRAIREAMLSYFDDKNIDRTAHSTLVDKDEYKGLLDLYETAFGKKDWRITWGRCKGFGRVLQQDLFVMALFGAGIYQEVFSKDLPWDLGREFHELLGDKVQYFRQVMDDFGREMRDFLRYAVGKQITDVDFQENEVAEHARVLAERLALVLQPHLLALTKTKRKSDDGSPRSWIHYLQEAFKQAIIIKQTLNASHTGRCRYTWDKAGTQIDRVQHKPYSEREGAARIFHTMVPGVLRVGEGDPVTICKMVVVLVPPSKK